MLRPTVLVATTAILVAACSSKETSPSNESALNRERPDPTRGSPALEQAAADVRRVTASYRNFELGVKAGYSTQITDCMANGSVGAMGFHYGQVGLIDALVEPSRPEVLLYEPGREGRMELVGVEYLVPLSAWSAPEPPNLLGVPFLRNDTFQVWALHFWVWRKNPTGIFSDWNPRVSCAAANPAQIHNH